MSPTHSDSPPTPVAGVGEGDGSKDGVRRSRAVPQTPREGVRTELRPSDPSLRSELPGDGAAPSAQVLKGVPSGKFVAPGGQGSPERRSAGTTSKARGSGQKSPPRGASQGTGSGGLNPAAPEPSRAMPPEPLLPIQGTPESPEFCTPRKATGIGQEASPVPAVPGREE